VHFVAGHPVLRDAMPELIKGLGVKIPAQVAQRWQRLERRGMHELQYGSRSRQFRAISAPFIASTLVAAGALALRSVVRHLRSRE
jgi:hypothetical protein